MEFVDSFEAARPRLMSLAHRILGSHHDAEDAVQTAWARARSSDLTEVVNLDGWLTTVTARVCLDLLRARERRGELPLLADDLPEDRLTADETLLQREEVSRALLVVLGELSPRQRVAYVLHDLFSVPFQEVAAVLDTNPTSAKKLASRARARLREAQPADGTPDAEDIEIIEAFLSAARGGDLERLVALMAPQVVRTADLALLPPNGRTEVRGARAVAEETSVFIDRIATAVPLLVSGRPAAVIAPGGHPYALIHVRVEAGLVAGIDIVAYPPSALR